MKMVVDHCWNDTDTRKKVCPIAAYLSDKWRCGSFL